MKWVLLCCAVCCGVFWSGRNVITMAEGGEDSEHITLKVTAQVRAAPGHPQFPRAVMCTPLLLLFLFLALFLLPFVLVFPIALR